MDNSFKSFNTEKGALKILQICSKPPVPAVDGGCIAMLSATKALLMAGHQVKILTIETPKHPYKYMDEESELIINTDLESIFIDTSVTLTRAIKGFFKSSYNVSRFYSLNFENRIKEIFDIKDFDIIQLESLYTTPYIKSIRKLSPKSKIVLRTHNVEHEIWFQKFKQEKNLFKSFYLKHLAEKLREYEVGIIKKVDSVIAISEKDAAYFSKINSKIPVLTIKTGIQLATESGNCDENNLFFIGSFDWQPNLEGILWFLENVWPDLILKFPTLKFYIAGRKMPERLLKMKLSGVQILGEIEDASLFIRKNGIMVVPLFSGSGIRIKILEAMAAGKVVISTSMGAEGSGATDNKNILLANTPAEFSEAISKCLSDLSFLKETGKNASSFAKENYSLESISRKFDDYYKRLISL
jgi:polysaccharide biosynthesis protein PslH